MKVKTNDWVHVASAALLTRDVLRSKVAEGLLHLGQMEADPALQREIGRIYSLVVSEADRLRIALKERAGCQPRSCSVRGWESAGQ